MKSFTVRKKGFEAEFKRNQELLFQVTARRNRLFGLWAAVRLGLPAGEEAEAYAKTVVAADFEAPGSRRPKRRSVTSITPGWGSSRLTS
jgi:hypothetical protein